MVSSNRAVISGGRGVIYIARSCSHIFAKKGSKETVFSEDGRLRGFFVHLLVILQAINIPHEMFQITYLVFLGLLTILVLDNTRAVSKADEQTNKKVGLETQ